MWQDTVLWIFTQQRQLHEALVDAFSASNSGSATAFGLIGLSFLYGLFHAAGPGHGKAVIATYLTAQKEQLARGVTMAVLGALCQGVTAIVLVYGLVGIAGWLPRETDAAVDWSERASFLLLVIMGLWLLKRAWNSLRSMRKTHAHDHHGHAHHEHGHHDHGHHHHHDHDDHCGCGHTHAPDPAEIARHRNSLKAMALIVLTIGLRPCTGAVLILVFAKVSKQDLTGVLAVMAMSAGTAIAVGTLACLTVFMRDWASARMASSERHAGILKFGQSAALTIGGIILLLLGASLLMTSFRTAAHPLGL
tara:strand:+ start:276 stop:1193 length:918 start_codon:yes stop_codon:yes gene_type:complete